MADPTEQTINQLIAEYLRDHDFNITAETSTKDGNGNRRQVDFELRDEGNRKFYGEGEWNETFREGLNQAIEYGDLPGASGYFLIVYEDDLGSTVKQKRLQTMDPEELFSGHEFEVLFKTKGEGRPATFKDEIEALPEWLEGAMEDEGDVESEVFINLMRNLVEDLADFIPSSQDHPALFKNIFPELDEGNRGVKYASAYVLMNQIFFYRILASHNTYLEIDPDRLSHPTDLQKKYFGKIPDDSYEAVFDVDVTSLVDQSGLDHIKDMIRYVDELNPEEFSTDLLGNTFHSLIPLEVRKSVAAYYTNPQAARLLANLSIFDADADVVDFACGSGTLLLGSYERKADLLFGDINEEVHSKFVDQHLTGVDIMPFAAHLATVQLALQNPDYDTHATRIAIEDSTVLNPGGTITPQQKSLVQGKQKSISEYNGDEPQNDTIEGGSTTVEFEVNEVDTVIMNPPFTRKQKVTPYYRSELRKRLSDYLDYIDDEMGFYGYFVPLADKFLRDEGRIAMVLPASVLQQVSMEGIRKLLQEGYTLEHIILTRFRSAFSEDTSLRDILLVARKDPDGDDPCRVSSLSVLPEEGNLRDLVKGLTQDIDGEFENDLLHTVEISQSKFRETLDWMNIVRQTVDVEFFYDYPNKDNFEQFGEQIDSMIGGLRLENSSDYIHPDNSLISHPRDVNVHTDWEITADQSTSFEVESVDRGSEVTIPNSVLSPVLRSISGVRTMEVPEPPDYVVMDEFPGDDEFWWTDDPDLQKRRKHVQSREGQLVLGGYGNLDLTAPGTSFLAVTDEDGIAPTWSLWSVSPDSWEDAKLLALWWNSTYSVAKLITERNEVRGGVMKWRKGDLKELPVPDLAHLTDDEKEELLEVYDEVSDHDFPALIHQVETNFEARMKIDRKWNEVLDWNYDDGSIKGLQRQIHSFLKDMEELMNND